MDKSAAIHEEIDQAIRLRDKGAWKKAVIHFKKIIQNSPSSSDAFAHLAKVYFLQRRYQKSIEFFNKALSLNRKNIYALTNLGITYFEIGELNNAVCSYDLALGLTNDEKETKLIQHWLDMSINSLKRVKALGVDSSLNREAMSVALYKRANSFTLEGDLDKGIEAYELAAKCRVNYSNNEIDLGITVNSHNERMPGGEYPSCSWLEEGLHFHDNRLTFCCTAHSVDKGWTPVGQFNGGKLPIDFILAKRAQVAHQLQKGTANNCSGCPSLKTKKWTRPKYLFSELIFNNFSVCNFRCTYCSLTQLNFEMPAYYYESANAVQDLIENKWLNPGGSCSWGGGDPSVSKEFPDLLKKMTNLGSFSYVCTNAAIHIPEIDEALQKGKANVVVSIDAGTSEVFDAIKFGNEDTKQPTLIKGIKAYDAVWNTLGKYIDIAPNLVHIKYIVDNQNASLNEIERFIVKCVSMGAKVISFTPEAEFIRQIPITRSLLPAHIFNAIKHGTSLAIKNNIECRFDENVYIKELFSPLENNLISTTQRIAIQEI